MRKSEILAWLLGAICLILMMWLCYENKRKAAEVVDSVTVETVVEIDTVAAVAPKPVEMSVIEQRKVKLPVHKNVLKDSLLGADVELSGNKTAYSDTVEVVLPIERKVYADSSYKAVISGYDVSLDTIEIYNRHEITTIRHEITTSCKPKRWGIGIVAGYGYTPGGFKPFVGVAVSYTIFRF